MEPSHYAYNLYHDLPLDHLRKEVRVLVIHQGRSNDPLQCSLKIVSLNEVSVSFDALSYVWGNEGETKNIIVNHLSVTVTKSLANALENLRDHSVSHIYIFDQPTLTIWVDAICINQSDLRERNQQVQMMGDIYSSARHVVIWLGDGDEHTNYALGLMNSTIFREELNDLGISRTRPRKEEIIVDVVLKQVLCKNKWWQRVWVRQEFILASKEPIFCCGAKMIPWDQLLHCFLLMPRSWDYPDLESIWDDCRKEMASSIDNSDANDGIHPISLHRIRESFQQRGALPICDIFKYLLRNAMATNPRDLVYGMLGLLDEQVRKQIAVDYELEPMQVYQQVGYLLWKQHTNQTLSELLPRLNFHGMDNGFPSWVPDFAAQPIRGWRDHRTIHAIRPWRKQSESPFKSGQDVLELQGLMFDVVKKVVITPVEFGDVEEIASVLRDIEELLLEAVNCPIPPDSPLEPLSDLKRQESMLQTLAKSAVETGDLFPGLDDEQVWAMLVGRETRPPEPSRPFHRLSKMLKGKFSGRKVVITEAGFVGIGVPQIEVGDVVAFIFGTTAPLVLRRYRDGYRIVGCAYVSGLMNPDLLDRYHDKMAHLEVPFNII
ncbi:HET-domain-containing protein [Fusarium austroafricanum]|uniref:HET-domain-containing protein n=1 Tax=Fusarium austroafricanum TaxID=2364996 RepID=A0A8H4JNE4_9HYPO|nr:HET-domain-containing protein [Fusarium austroafricanum]